MAHVFNVSRKEPTYYRSLLAVSRGKFEGSIKCGRDGPHFPKLDFIDIGVTRLDPKANFSATLSLKPQELSRYTSELHVGLRKSFAQNFLVKAKYALASGLGTYYASYAPNSDTTIAGTLQVAHRAKQGVFKGFWGYPLNFGLQLTLNA